MTDPDTGTPASDPPGTTARAADFPSAPVLAGTMSPKFMKEYRILPLSLEEGILRLAMADTRDMATIEQVEVLVGCRVVPVAAAESEILAAVDRLHGEAGSIRRIVEDMAPDEEGESTADRETTDVDHLRDMASEAPVIRMVNLLIQRAAAGRASDIHFEPFEDRLVVRYRIDGILHEAESPPKRLQAAIISRLKIMARMNIAESRLPQDGRIRMNLPGHDLDIRVSSIPTVHGESVVLRLLDRASVFIGLEDLGFDSGMLELFGRLIKRPYGMILVTGPTGSGKTTTLYGALARINSTDRKIITIEDPVEYQLAGINQIQVKSKIGLDFASGLRSIVRQDPDVIMVGEIRDRETAEIAVQSALTGHLVFSTVHTNDAAGAVTRLRDMGVENYLISSSVIGIMAQRLVRRICPNCRVPDPSAAALLRQMGVEPPADADFARGTGCEACAGTGFRGRVGIFELMAVDDAVRRLVMTDPGADTIRNLAVSQGMVTLRRDGFVKVARGLTTLAEVIRVTQEE
jgi:general secretion pathway protein E